MILSGQLLGSIVLAAPIDDMGFHGIGVGTLSVLVDRLIDVAGTGDGPTVDYNGLMRIGLKIHISSCVSIGAAVRTSLP